MSGQRWLCAALFMALLASPAWAREIVDMRGRQVRIPDRIDKVFATSPPGTYLVYAIDPALVAGLNFPLWGSEKRYTVQSYQRLPVIGGTVGMGRELNQEVLLKVKPDLIVIWDWGETAVTAEYEAIFRRMGIPWAFVKADSVWEYPEALSFVGRLLGREARGKALRDRAKTMLARVRSVTQKISKGKPPTVFYAEGPDGLATEQRGSFHAELIEITGGTNVHRSAPSSQFGMQRVSMEQVLVYDPDVILAKEKVFFDTVYTDPRWAGLRAVRAKRVYLIPYVPFNWFDRPPSFMRILGAEWVFSKLYPGHLAVDLNRETREFYRAFLGIEIDAQRAAEILGP